jgi:hypothetical protein
MTAEQLRAHRRTLMDRGDHHGVQLCNQALCPATSTAGLQNLLAILTAAEDLRESVLRGEA